MKISAIHHRLGSRAETLADLCEINPDWQLERLVAKTGIVNRHVIGENDTALGLAEEACLALFRSVDRASIDGLIYVTQSPESTIPATACLLHESLQLPAQCLAFDLNQGCSGFVYGLSMATGLLISGQATKCLVVCAESYSKYISHHDRTCRPIFSDGASAAIIDGQSNGKIGPFVFSTDGSGAPNLTLRDNKSAEVNGDKVLFMNGPKVLEFTMEAVPEAVEALLAKSGLELDRIDLFVFHQASKVVLDRIMKRLSIAENRLYRNYEDVGNTVSATIPIALQQAQIDGILRPNMTVLLMGFGVGYSLAGCIIRT